MLLQQAAGHLVREIENQQQALTGLMHCAGAPQAALHRARSQEQAGKLVSVQAALVQEGLQGILHSCLGAQTAETQTLTGLVHCAGALQAALDRARSQEQAAGKLGSVQAAMLLDGLQGVLHSCQSVSLAQA